METRDRINSERTSVGTGDALPKSHESRQTHGVVYIGDTTGNLHVFSVYGL